MPLRLRLPCLARRALCAATVVLVCAPLSARADFAAGLAAYEAGRFDEAVTQWTPLAEKGDHAAQFNLGVIYEKGKVGNRDLRRAAWYYRAAAEGGHVKAMLNIGNCYANGKGVGQNYQEAFLWMRKAAHAGDPDAQYNVAIMLYNGWGTDRKRDAAIAWMKRAVDLKVPGADERYDVMTGKKGTPPDLIP